MTKIDAIIDQIKQGIKCQEVLIAREDSKTEEGVRTIEIYRHKIAELEYRIRELEEKKKGNLASLIPEYNDGKYASDSYKEAFDMLRVCYYKYFQQDPVFSPVPKRDMMFYDPTLYMPVDTYLVRGRIPFQILFSANYPEHKSDSSKSISIELPFEVLSKEENEEYLRCMLDLIKVYSGDGVNFIFGNGESTRGTLSYIADRDLSIYSRNEKDYYEFFERFGDNIVRNIMYIGDSMKHGVTHDTLDKVQNNIIDFHKRLIANELMSEEELERSNEKIKKRILLINNQL